MQYSYIVDKLNSNGKTGTVSGSLTAKDQFEAERKVREKFGEGLVRITSLRPVGAVNNRTWHYRVKTTSPNVTSGTVQAANQTEAIRQIHGKYKERLVQILELR